ncbi:hypothetical protein DFR69_106184 [Nocardia neocaledoniensis]|uniref:Uncharacterized protein n=2 Tax=Nocardia neocaledoniensis TaxID=236511 RepID=A0A317NHK8_9NOCA|nr:hypothetical protein DFR69_106184 [Nocardia neocaledoniensis]
MSCPQCQRVDWVQNVPAVMSDGTHGGYSTGTYAGVGIAPGGLFPVAGTSTHEYSHSSALARSLAWQPILPSASRLFAVGVGLGLFVLLLYVLCIDSLRIYPPSGSPGQVMVYLIGLFMVPVGLSVPVVAILIAAVKRSNRSGKVQAGRNRARGVWSHAYYCHRCGVAYWPYPTEPGVPHRVPLAPAQFRWHVWNTGGYAKL